MQDEKLMTARQAAKYMQLSSKWGYTTVQRWIRLGLLKAGRAGDIYLLRKSDIDDFVFSKK